MSHYTVVWVESAQNELAELWLHAPDRITVTLAADAIDQVLAANAPDKGIELSEGLRAFYASPLRVIFSVREDDRIVEVLSVRSA